jgi:hypothetical protein
MLYYLEAKWRSVTKFMPDSFTVSTEEESQYPFSASWTDRTVGFNAVKKRKIPPFV